MKVVFASRLLSRQSEMSYKIAQRIDNDLNVTLPDNPEIRQRWFPLVISLDYLDAFPAIKAFV